MLTGLAALWALDRATGRSRTAAWDATVAAARIYGASRLVEAAVGTPGAATADGQAASGAAAWRGLVAGVGGLGWTDPEVVGDRILSALGRDGAAARRFLLDLATSRDRRPLVALLANDVADPAVSGGLLLASTNPGTVRSAADADEVRRSLQAVLPVIDRLLARGEVSFPPRPVARPSRTAGCCPSALGSTSAGTSSISSTRLTAPARAHPTRRPGRGRAGASARCRASSAVSWPTTGWRPSLVQAAPPGGSSGWPAWTCSHRPAPRRCAPQSFALGAADGLLGDRVVARAVADCDRFDAMVAGADLVVNAAGLVLPAAGGAGLALKAWGPVSEASVAAGLPSGRKLLLSPFAPASTAAVMARQEAGEGLADAELKGAVATLALGQAAARAAARAAPATDAGRPGRPCRSRGRRGHPPGRQRQRARRAPPRPARAMAVGRGGNTGRGDHRGPGGRRRRRVGAGPPLGRLATRPNGTGGVRLRPRKRDVGRTPRPGRRHRGRRRRQGAAPRTAFAGLARVHRRGAARCACVSIPSDRRPADGTPLRSTEWLLGRGRTFRRGSGHRESDPQFAVRGADPLLPLRRQRHHGRDRRGSPAELVLRAHPGGEEALW